MKTNGKKTPILGFIAPSGTGKTTLLEKLIPKLTAHQLRIGVIKSTHHHFDIDKPGKDSYRLRQAGASQTIIASHQRWALVTENPKNQTPPNLHHLVSSLDCSQIDLILVEGFKEADIPRIELHRTSVNNDTYLYPNDENIIAIATDCRELPQPTNITHIDINNIDAMTDFILQRLSHWSTSKTLTTS